jgi:hypothetical protein
MKSDEEKLVSQVEDESPKARERGHKSMNVHGWVLSTRFQAQYHPPKAADAIHHRQISCSSTSIWFLCFFSLECSVLSPRSPVRGIMPSNFSLQGSDACTFWKIGPQQCTVEPNEDARATGTPDYDAPAAVAGIDKGRSCF